MKSKTQSCENQLNYIVTTFAGCRNVSPPTLQIEQAQEGSVDAVAGNLVGFYEEGVSSTCDMRVRQSVRAHASSIHAASQVIVPHILIVPQPFMIAGKHEKLTCMSVRILTACIKHRTACGSSTEKV